MSDRTTPTGCRITRTGIVIGGAYSPPPPAPSRDAEVIQATLLKARRSEAQSLLVRALRVINGTTEQPRATRTGWKTE